MRPRSGGVAVVDAPSTEPSLVIVGLGNPLHGDDGVGVAALDELVRTYALPSGVEAVDGGTLGLSLVPCLAQTQWAILLDAAVGGPPGTLVRCRGDEVPAVGGCRLSPHQLGVADLLSTLRLAGGPPLEQVIVWGVMAESLDRVGELSSLVAAALPRLLAAVVEEIKGLGFPMARCTTPTGHGRDSLAGSHAWWL
jgi:hydrogenase maturation protease